MFTSSAPSRSVTAVGWLAFLLGFSLPISTALDNLLLLALVVAWCVAGDWRGKWERLSANPPALAIGALLLLSALGLAWGLGEWADKGKYFGKYANLILALCLISLPLPETRRREALWGFGLATLLILALSYGLWLGLVPPGWKEGWSAANPVVFKARITHSFFIALGGYFFLIQALYARERWLQALLGALALAALGNVLLTDGRTGLVAVAGLAAYLFIARFRWRGVAVSAVALAAGVAAVALAPQAPLVKRLHEGVAEVQKWQYGRADESSMGLRMQFAATSLRIIADHPLSGVGTGGFEAAYAAEIAQTEARVSNNPHNQYLLTTAQLGLPGLLLLLAVFILAWRRGRLLDPGERLLLRGFLVAFAVGNLFHSFLFDHAEALFFAWFTGLLLGFRPSASLSPRH